MGSLGSKGHAQLYFRIIISKTGVSDSFFLLDNNSRLRCELSSRTLDLYLLEDSRIVAETNYVLILLRRVHFNQFVINQKVRRVTYIVRASRRNCFHDGTERHRRRRLKGYLIGDELLVTLARDRLAVEVDRAHILRDELVECLIEGFVTVGIVDGGDTFLGVEGRAILVDIAKLTTNVWFGECWLLMLWMVR